MKALLLIITVVLLTSCGNEETNVATPAPVSGGSTSSSAPFPVEQSAESVEYYYQKCDDLIGFQSLPITHMWPNVRKNLGFTITQKPMYQIAAMQMNNSGMLSNGNEKWLTNAHRLYECLTGRSVQEIFEAREKRAKKREAEKVKIEKQKQVATEKINAKVNADTEISRLNEIVRMFSNNKNEFKNWANLSTNTEKRDERYAKFEKLEREYWELHKIIKKRYKGKVDDLYSIAPDIPYDNGNWGRIKQNHGKTLP